MKFGRYLVVLVWSWLLGAAAVVGFTVLVDPIGISPVRIAIAGFNTLKPLQQDYDWIVKRYDVGRNQPTTVFMGSSRIKQSVDPKLFAGTAFAPAYNGGLNGSANLAETRAYLRDYLKADKNLHHVFIEAFATALLDLAPIGPFVRSADGEHEPTDCPRIWTWSDIADMASAFFSMSGLNSAIRTVVANRGQDSELTAASSDDGFAPIPLAPHHFSVRNVFNFVLHTGLLRRGGRVSPPMLAAAREMIATCDRYQVDCQILCKPAARGRIVCHLPFGAVARNGKLEARTCGARADLRFYALQPLDRRAGRAGCILAGGLSFFPGIGRIDGAGHDGPADPDMPQNFGVLMDAKNIESSLIAWRQERDDWIAQHPALVERMRKAEDDFLRGVPFQAVTDAEIATGEW